MFTKRIVAATMAALALASTALAWTAGSGSGGDVLKWDAGDWKIKSTTAPAKRTDYSHYVEKCTPDTSASPPGVCQDEDFDAVRVDGSAWADALGDAYVRCLSVDLGGGEMAYHMRFVDDPANHPPASSWPSTLMCVIQADHDGDGDTEDLQYRVAIKPL